MNTKLILFFIIFSTSFIAQAVDVNDISLDHITNAQQLQNYKGNHPDIDDDICEEGYRHLQEEQDFSPLVTDAMLNYPVWGTWLILNKTIVVGRITLEKPTPTHPYSEIFTWIEPRFRSIGIAKIAREKLYAAIRPFVGMPVSITWHCGPRTKHVDIMNFRGIESRIAPDNFASLISQLNAGACISSVECDDNRLAMIHLVFPPDEHDRKETHSSETLVRLRAIEPSLRHKESRATALAQLKKLMSRPRPAHDLLENRGVLRLRLPIERLASHPKDRP